MTNTIYSDCSGVEEIREYHFQMKIYAPNLGNYWNVTVINSSRTPQVILHLNFST